MALEAIIPSQSITTMPFSRCVFPSNHQYQTPCSAFSPFQHQTKQAGPVPLTSQKSPVDLMQESEIVVVYIFAPGFFSLAIMLALLELFRHPRHRHGGNRSRTPLLPRRNRRQQRKPRKHFWQVWRERRLERTEDVEQGLRGASPQHTTNNNNQSGDNYGTFLGIGENPFIPFRDPFRTGSPGENLFDDFDGIQPAAAAQSQRPAKITPDASSFSHKYDLIRTFKDVSQAAVHLVKCHKTGKPRIIKQMYAPIDEKTREPYMPEEADILLNQLVKHTNILHLVEAFPVQNAEYPTWNLVFEYCDAGDIFNFNVAVDKRGETVPEMFILHFVSSMIDALALLHHGDVWHDPVTDTTRSVRHRQERLIHRDIKPQNIFMTWSEKPRYGLPTIVLGDFGFTCNEANNTGAPYTAGYDAPEIRHPAPPNYVCSTASDMYAFGVSMFELFTGFLYAETADIDADFQNTSVKHHPKLLKLLKQCLAKKPSDRPVANQLHSLSSELKSILQAWYDEGGKLPEHIWPDPFKFEEPSINSPVWSAGSSHYSGPAPTSPASTIPASIPSIPRGLRRVPGQLHLKSYVADVAEVARQSSSFSAALPTRAPTPVQPETHAQLTTADTASPVIDLFTGQQATQSGAENTDTPQDLQDAEISSIRAEIASIASYGPSSAFSSDSSEDGLYF